MFWKDPYDLTYIFCTAGGAFAAGGAGKFALVLIYQSGQTNDNLFQLVPREARRPLERLPELLALLVRRALSRRELQRQLEPRLASLERLRVSYFTAFIQKI